MGNIESLLRAAFGEMEKVMTARTVVGDAATFGELTVIPLVSIKMGFGAGAGAEEGKEGSEGGGAGGGVSIKPVAVIILEKEGVRIEQLHPGRASTQQMILEKAAEFIPKLAEGVPKMMKKHGEEEEKPPKEAVSVPVTE
ncbi:MAG: sporulation protein YtfJ [Methanotrichaceae archaeon]|nr:sporulation protein YtfJ [Methanotrichaceae archaeon]